MSNSKDWASRLLRHGERFFKLDIVYITKGGFWTALRFIVGIAASVASMMAFGNLLLKENYGIYSYLLSLASSLSFLTLSGMGPGIIRAVAQEKENVLRYAIRLQLRYNLLAVATVGVAAVYYYSKGNGLFAISLGILALVMPLEAAYHTFEHILIGRKRFDTIAILTSLSSIGSTVATVITLFTTDSVLVIISVYAITSIGPTYLSYWLITKDIPKQEPNTLDTEELRRTAFHITGAGIIGTLAQYVDKVVLFHFAGPTSLAIYGFAIAGPERFKGLIKDWINITQPRLAQRNILEIRRAFYKRIVFLTVFGVAISTVYVLLSPLLFKALLPKYLDSIIYSQVYALGLVIIPTLIYMGNIFYSQNMLRAIYITSTFSQVTRIIILVFAGWKWHAWGLVIGFLVSQIISVLFNLIIWEKESRRMEKNL